MTVAEAKKALEPPLVFGNEAQIKALAFLEKVEEAKARIAECENLDDHVQMDDSEDGAIVMDDGEDGAIVLELDDCACTVDFADDVAVAAMRETIKDLRNA